MRRMESAGSSLKSSSGHSDATAGQKKPRHVYPLQRSVAEQRLERKGREAEEEKTLNEQTVKTKKKLQEFHISQREIIRKIASLKPAHVHLVQQQQEEEAQLGKKAIKTVRIPAPPVQQRQKYQPSVNSDEPAQSPQADRSHPSSRCSSHRSSAHDFSARMNGKKETTAAESVEEREGGLVEAAAVADIVSICSDSIPSVNEEGESAADEDVEDSISHCSVSFHAHEAVEGCHKNLLDASSEDENLLLEECRGIKSQDMNGASSGSHEAISLLGGSSCHSSAHDSAASMNWENEDAAEEYVEEGDEEMVMEEDDAAAEVAIFSDSIPAVNEDGDSAVECSPDHDGSVEDEVEESWIHSPLLSEAYEILEKSSSLEDNSVKSQDVSVASSGGQQSFSCFTTDAARQLIEESEKSLQIQNFQLHAYYKALKEKTQAEVAWLQCQKKMLRGNGEEETIPWIRNKQKDLLLNLQQEKAATKHLLKINKAARKEKQQLLKQHDMIERMRRSTLRLKERLKCAGAETAI